MDLPAKPTDMQIYQGLWERLVMACDGDESAANTYLQETFAEAISRLIDVKAQLNG